MSMVSCQLATAAQQDSSVLTNAYSKPSCACVEVSNLVSDITGFKMTSRTEEILASTNAEKEFRRLFVLGVKDIDAEELRSYFSQYGTLTELKKTVDKNGFDRGISIFIVFCKVVYIIVVTFKLII